VSGARVGGSGACSPARQVAEGLHLDSTNALARRHRPSCRRAGERRTACGATAAIDAGAALAGKGRRGRFHCVHATIGDMCCSLRRFHILF
jgi:hypothetical protein